MTENPRTIGPEMSLSDAFSLFREGGYRRLPVVKKEKLVGIITMTDMQKLLACIPGKLDPIDPTHLLVSNVMTHDPVTAKANDPIEHAALLMSKNGVRAIPIIDEHDKPIGIITETDMFRAFLRIMGVNERGTRLLLELPEGENGLADILALAEAFDVELLSIVTHRSPQGENHLAVIRVKGMDIELFLDELGKSEHRVLEVSK
jgi:acetoin utilization protein AcuB